MRTLTLLALAAATCTAGAGESRFFQLGNHPDGAQNPPPYGLRMDGLFGGGVTSFDFDTNDGVFLTVTDDTMNGGGVSIEIAGSVFGGEIDGNGGYTDGGQFYDINFVYTASVQITSNGWKVVGTDNTSNTGSIALAGSNNPADIFTITDNNNNAFLFQADGHRLAGDSDSWVGRGWLTTNTDGTNVGNTQDWLFTAVETDGVPTPGTLGLAAIGGLVASRRRRA
jgi:MYXO-CTERM domain-containing protein